MTGADLPLGLTPADAPAAGPRPTAAWLRPLAAGAAYAGMLFLVGCLAGVIRELVLAPRITSDLGIVVETPLMMWVAFHLARASGRWLGVAPGRGGRLVMGAAALAVLLSAENAASHAWLGRSVFEQWSLYGYLALGATLSGLVFTLLAPLVAAARPLRQPSPPRP